MNTIYILLNKLLVVLASIFALFFSVMILNNKKITLCCFICRLLNCVQFLVLNRTWTSHIILTER